MSRHTLWNADKEVVVGYEPAVSALFLQVFPNKSAERPEVHQHFAVDAIADLMKATLEHCSLTPAIHNSVKNHILEEIIGMTSTLIAIDWTKEMPMITARGSVVDVERGAN